jgi:hypothetical protein
LANEYAIPLDSNSREFIWDWRSQVNSIRNCLSDSRHRDKNWVLGFCYDMKNHKHIQTTFLAALLFATTLSAQQVGGRWSFPFEYHGEAGDKLGNKLSGAGDINQDGYEDIIIGADRAGSGGEAYVYSGLDGSLLLHFDAPSAGTFFGSAVDGAGDVNADGYPDVIIGAQWASPGGISYAGSTYIYSGLDGELIYQFDAPNGARKFGNAVAGVGDVNLDGFDDVLIGAYWDSGSAFLYSGLDGSLLLSFAAFQVNDMFGVSVAGAGDVDLDGHNDLLIGAWKADPNGLVDAGSAYVFSGSDGSLVLSIHGAQAGDNFGVTVANASDIDDDGVPDQFIGAYSASPGATPLAGSAFVYSGAKETVLFQLDGEEPGDRLGSGLDAGMDVSGDGVPDLLVGAGLVNLPGVPAGGSAYLFDGSSGMLIQRFDGSESGGHLGNAVALVGASDPDGRADLWIAAPEATSEAGSVYVHAFDPLLSSSSLKLSASTGGTVFYLLDFDLSEANFQYQMLASASGIGPSFFGGVAVPLTIDGLFTRTSTGSYPSQFFGFTGVLDANGQSWAAISTGPLGASLVGREYHVAAVVGALGGIWELSSAPASLTIAP